MSATAQGEGDGLREVAKTLTARTLMTNESKKTRALVGLCVSDLMRIFAPEAPIEGDAAMRDVYELFLDGLTNLKSIESEELKSRRGC